jgi:CSLREA domain-containing protein
MRGWAAAAVILSFAGLLVGAPGALGAQIQVTVAYDEFSSNPEVPACSLREAIQTANTDADALDCVREGSGPGDTITLDGGTAYALSRPGTLEDANETGDLDVTGETAIDVGGGGRATIDGDDLDRVIDVRSGGTLIADHVVIQDGNAQGDAPDNRHGGGVYVGPGAALELTSSRVTSNNTVYDGGGIFNDGVTELRRVTIDENVAGVFGGGLFNAGDLKVADTTFSGNEGEGGGGLFLDNAFEVTHVTLKRTSVFDNDALDADGGGIEVYVGTDKIAFRATNVTISGNRAADRGGGVFAAGCCVKLNAATITGNSANLGGGVVAPAGGGLDGSEVHLVNSIVAGNGAPGPADDGADCGFQAGNRGHNVVGKNTGCSQGGSNVAVTDPMLKPLADNGGPTLTHALKAGSRAIGAAGKSTPARDQRGHKRDSHPDAGAFER